MFTLRVEKFESSFLRNRISFYLYVVQKMYHRVCTREMKIEKFVLPVYGFNEH